MSAMVGLRPARVNQDPSRNLLRGRCVERSHGQFALAQLKLRGPFRGRGLRATQFTILAGLAQAGPIAISELAKILGLERTTHSLNLRLIVARGWVSAIASDDRRVCGRSITSAVR